MGLRMDDIKLPKRDSRVYTDIEKLKDYELTNCIAYEMAIRNDMNIKNIDKFVRKFLSEDLINNNYQIILDQKDFKASKEYSYNLTDNMISPFGLYLKNYSFFEELRNFINNEKKKYKKFQEGRKKIFIENDFNNINFDLEGRDFDKFFFYKDEYKNTDKIDTNKKIIYNHLVETNFFTSFTRYIKNKGTNEAEIKPAEITPKYSRPLLYIPFAQYKTVKLNLNLELPIKDLEDTVRKLKQEFINDITFTLSPSEFDGSKLTSIDKEIESILSNQTKVSDMFYVYDCIKLNITQRKIQNQIYNYYADKGIETKTMDPKTLKKYKEVAIEYIDNFKYKELLTSIK